MVLPLSRFQMCLITNLQRFAAVHHILKLEYISSGGSECFNMRISCHLSRLHKPGLYGAALLLLEL